MREKSFRGKRDPNRIELLNVFPLNTTVFTSPLHAGGERCRVFMEGDPETIDFLYMNTVKLRGGESSNSLFGKWDNIVPEDDRTLVMVHSRTSGFNNKETLELLTQVLYMDLAGICGLAVSNNSTIRVFERNIETLKKPVYLPQDVQNGSIEVPIIALPRNLIL